MGKVALIGDVGGHPDQLRRALAWLGVTSERLPPELTVIQVGDLVDRGPDSAGVLDIAGKLLEDRQWIQLAGNHETQYLPGGEIFWREPLPEGDVTRLREWWADGRLRVAEAVRTADGEELLVTHAGLTLACWQRLGGPTSATETAAILNERPDLIWERGEHGRDEDAGPLWAESGAALHEPWMGYFGVVPFGQVHGHSTVVRFAERTWRCAGRIRHHATVDWRARHVRVRIGGRVFTGIDPGHGRTGADEWRPLILDDAHVTTPSRR